MFAKKSISCLFSVLVIIVFMLAVMPLQAAQAAGVLYVKPTASGTGDCSIWANACILQTALTGAVSGDEIWVAAGVYKPTTDTTNRTATFQLIDGVAVYGGFVGTETARTQRDPTANVTILSGDIDNNDSQTPIITNLATVTGNTTNSYHVVTGATGATLWDTLDGFTITAGNANGASYLNNSGGGMYNVSSLGPMLTNITFSGDSASYYGGGIYNWNCSPILMNVTFSGNSANDGGGGMYNNDLSKPTFKPTLTNVTFSGDSATDGGGISNFSSSPILTNVTFSGNSATDGGGMYNTSSSPTLKNVTFSGDSATDGGGMYNYSSSPSLTNVTFSGDSASYSGGGIYNYYNSSPLILNTVFWGNTASIGAQIENYDAGSTPGVSYSVVQSGCPTGSTCTNIVTADPKLGTLGNYGGFTQTIPILPSSSAIDTGYDVYCPATDQRGVTRPQGAHCDIGAFEAKEQYTISGNAGVAGATLSYTDGTAKTATADGSGTYSFTVSPNWSGTVMPSKIGYAFTPTDDTYTNVLADQTGQNYIATPVATFADVPTTYWAWNWIERLYHAGITGGCGTSPLIYCPDSAVTRAQMAIFLERGMNGSSYTPPTGTGTVFGDVPISYWADSWIEKLYADGITGGCGGGNYCPANPVTRAQMAIFLLRAEHGSSYTPPPATGTVFGDVPISYWDAAWIEQLYAEGITGGCGGGNYCPANPVTRAQMAVFLVRTFNLP